MKWLNSDLVALPPITWWLTLLRWTVLLSAVSLSGCGTLFPASNNQIEQWIEHNHFSRADRAINRKLSRTKKAKTEEAKTEDHKNTLVDIEIRSAQYWSEIKTHTDALVAKEQWKQAQQQLSFAIDNLIDPVPAKKALKALLTVEEKALSRLNVNEAITRGKWLSREYARQQTLRNSTQGSILTPIAIQRLQTKQYALAAELVDHAQTALKEKKLQTTKQCYEVLNLILVPQHLIPTVAAIGQNLHQDKKSKLAYRQKTLAESLDKSIKNGKLVEATQIIEQLKKFKSLPNDILIKIDAVNSVLDYNADFLDEKADVYYREGKVELAKSIWDYLLKLNPASTDITLKLSRAEKVLKNMHELREGGHNASPTPAEASKSESIQSESEAIQSKPTKVDPPLTPKKPSTHTSISHTP